MNAHGALVGAGRFGAVAFALAAVDTHAASEGDEHRRRAAAVGS